MTRADIIGIALTTTFLGILVWVELRKDRETTEEREIRYRFMDTQARINEGVLKEQKPSLTVVKP